MSTSPTSDPPSPGVHSQNRNNAAASNAAQDQLRQIESLLKDIDAPMLATANNPSTTAGVSPNHHRGGASTKAAPTKRSLLAKAGPDCLAPEKDRQMYGGMRRTMDGHGGGGKSSTPNSPDRGSNQGQHNSAMRGVHMAGKDRAQKRYLGKGFAEPPADSPGPAVYDPVSTLNTAGTPCSFSKAPRNLGSASAASCSPGPMGGYAIPSSVGRQSVSTMKNATSAVFSKGGRFNEKEFISATHSKNMTATFTPGPGKYHEGVQEAYAAREKGIEASIGGSRCDKVFISRSHVVDSLGRASDAGPTYDGTRGQNAVSTHRASPAIGFGTAKRDVGQAKTPDPEAGSGVFHTGPETYNPVPVTKRAPSAVFCRGNSKKVFISKELSAGDQSESPGMIYNPETTAVDKHKPCASFGSVKGPQATQDANRFEEGVFLGKGLSGTVQGKASPGPGYNIDKATKDHGPSFSMVFKEKPPKKGVYPGPARTRWLSKETGKDNLGAFSPGPKYNVASDFSKSGQAHSFGVSDRYFNSEGFNEEHYAKFGTAEKPYTSPSEARFVSMAHSRLAMAGKASPGPALAPSDAICSHVKQPHSVKWSKEKTTARERPSDKGQEEKQKGVPPLAPKYEATKSRQPCYTFPKEQRHIGASSGGSGGNKGTVASSGTQSDYDIKWGLLEKKPVNVSLGPLS